MPDIVVAAQNRTERGKNVNRRLRTKGLIPGVLYGKAKKPVPVAVSPKEIGSILRSKTGENTLFDLDLDGSRRKVIHLPEIFACPVCALYRKLYPIFRAYWARPGGGKPVLLG